MAVLRSGYFAKALRGWRQAYDITQDEVATKLGIAKSTVSDVETGRSGPWNRVRIKKLSTAFALAELESTALEDAAWEDFCVWFEGKGEANVGG
jgi:predicted transcriptional regulator